ncbi:MAG: BON domain-containing protein [Pseudomonadales bacterium]
MRTLLFFIVLSLTACTATETRRSTGTVVDDATTITRIKAALLKNPVTDGLDIEVRGYKGRIQLNGFADSSEEVAEAGRITSAIRGVNNLANNLQIVPTSRRVGEYIDDKVLFTRLNAALARDRAVSNLQVDVEVNRGTVLLGGFVDNREEKEAAEAAARRVSGVLELKSFIEIR